MDEIRGVNLGNWLVLEKWMDPGMFDGTDAEDETFLCRALDQKEKESRYEKHRSSWITGKDFAFLADQGINLVRIPVPYFLFESFGSFVPCADRLDQAFEWAEKYGLKILVDLHTVPGGQNGTDNSGICGVCTWSTKEEYRTITLKVLEKIARNYGLREGLWGIEAVNEPMCSDTPAASYMNIHALAQFYKPKDPEMAKDNTNYPLSWLREFYRDAYRTMKPHLAEGKKIVFSDAFDLDAWDEFFEEEMTDVVLDTHQYLQMVEYGFGEERPFAKYESYLNSLQKKLTETAERIPLLVGEWSLGNMINDYEPAARDEVMKKLAEVYRKAVESGIGWCFWSYKLNVSDPDKDTWKLQTCLERNWIILK